MNIVAIAGNVVREVELRNTQTGKPVANFSIAINEGKDKTEFVNCIAWDKCAELINQYVQKGDRLSCSGRLQTRSWENQQGEKRYATEVVVDKFDFPPKSNKEHYDTQPQTHGNSVGFEEDEIPFAAHEKWFK